MVATPAAIAAAENQKDPVTKTLLAPSRNRSDPSTAASGWPLAMALLQADRSGRTPIGSQLDPRCSRNPHRTSSRINAAPVRSHSSRRPAGEGRVDQFLIEACVVLERADHDRGEIRSGFRGGQH